MCIRDSLIVHILTVILSIGLILGRIALTGRSCCRGLISCSTGIGIVTIAAAISAIVIIIAVIIVIIVIVAVIAIVAVIVVIVVSIIVVIVVSVGPDLRLSLITICPLNDGCFMFQL